MKCILENNLKNMNTVIKIVSQMSSTKRWQMPSMPKNGQLKMTQNLNLKMINLIVGRRKLNQTIRTTALGPKLKRVTNPLNYYNVSSAIKTLSIQKKKPVPTRIVK